jgi:PPOX class probable F420-dependent enzyme
MKLSQSTIEHLLDTWPVARLATTKPGGHPHQVPVVFVYHAGQLWSPVDIKPKSKNELVRVQNALANPAASLLLDQYSDDWSQLWWLHIDVEIRVIRLRDNHQDTLHTNVTGAVEALRLKYPQYQGTAVLREPPTLLAMRPRQFSSWSVAPGQGETNFQIDSGS